MTVGTISEFNRESVLADVVAQTSVRVHDLLPGDLVNLGGHSAVFIADTEHPIWPHLRMVIWRTDPALGLPGNWSHDALDFRQEVGTLTPATAVERAARLRDALLGGGDRG